MRLALEAGIYQFNVESEPELEALDEVAGAWASARRSRFRVNPDVDAKTHAKITTGTAETKFGIPWSRAREAYALGGELKASSRSSASMFISAARSPSSLRSKRPSRAWPNSSASLRARRTHHLPPRSGRRPGRALPHRQRAAARSCRLWRDDRAKLTKDIELPADPRARPADRGQCRSAGGARDLCQDRAKRKTFLILDAGMNDLIRPALYDAHHDIVPVEEPAPDAPRASAMMWSARSAKPRTFSRRTATCRGSNRAIWWRS